MKYRTFMFVAGEASGDLLAAELVRASQQEFLAAEAPETSDAQPLFGSLAPRFFGAGGPQMAKAGVDLAFDMTQHAVIGLWEPLKALAKFYRLHRRLYRLALEQRPDVIVCVDFGGFNLHFAAAIRRYLGRQTGWFHTWRPKLVQYVSPQVWASRPGRARRIARDYDLLLCTLPFEKAWYAARTPQLKVEWVGHPIFDRYGPLPQSAPARQFGPAAKPVVALLPGSRTGELQRHLPVLIEAAKLIEQELPSQFQLVVPNEKLADSARAAARGLPSLEVRAGPVAETLAQSDLALTKSGTITLECAYFGVPAVVMYKTSGLTYAAAKRFATVKYLSMPNLLADEAIFPEFIQHAATPEQLGTAALGLLRDVQRRAKVKTRLRQLLAQLGGPGASHRAAASIMRLFVRPAQG